MGYFSFSMTFVFIIGGACFFLIGCTATPKRLIDVADVPENKQQQDISCDIKKQREDLLQQGQELEQDIDHKIKNNIKELKQFRKSTHKL